MPKQVLENLKFLGRQRESLSRLHYSSCHGIHFKILVLELEDLIRSPAPEERGDAGEQLRDSERLDEVVVGSVVEATRSLTVSLAVRMRTGVWSRACRGSSGPQARRGAEA
jgi:hypothetical protein